jgi:hypothetical protein
MKRRREILIFAIIILLLGLNTNSMAKEKLAQTGFGFLSVGQDARAAAMGEAYTTEEGFASALFYNPAGMARFDKQIDVSVNYFNWIADIEYVSMAVIYRPLEGRFGTIGISVCKIDYGTMKGTIVWGNTQGYIDTGEFDADAMAIGIGYAKSLTDKFSVGGQIKNVGQALGKSEIPGVGVKRNVANTLAFDFGTIYHTGFKSLVFGMSVRNFSQEIKFEKESFQLPLTFKIGLSVNAMDFIEENVKAHSLLIIMDAVHPRSYPEYVNLGAEYTFQNVFSLRTGYISNQTEYGWTAGFGINTMGVRFSYAYTPFGVFDNVQRFSLSFSL